jgi:hypothetical protein
MKLIGFIFRRIVIADVEIEQELSLFFFVPKPPNQFHGGPVIDAQKPLQLFGRNAPWARFHQVERDEPFAQVSDAAKVVVAGGNTELLLAK